jgi:hypothetical protein
VIRGFLDFVLAFVRWVLAIVLCLLPGRYWPRFEAFPLARVAIVSAGLTIGVGIVFGTTSYVAYQYAAAFHTNEAVLHFAERQTRGEVPANVPVEAPTLRMLSVLSFPGFFLTPLGLASMYILLSGILRFASVVVSHPFGDPLLTTIDAAARHAATRVRGSWRRRRRARLEGPDVPDRLVTGRRAGMPDADYVVIASRRKEGWTRGAFVMTPDTWYRLGEPFDIRLPAGLRTAYPLTALQTTEVVRRGVRYELPPLDAPPTRRQPATTPERRHGDEHAADDERNDNHENQVDE